MSNTEIVEGEKPVEEFSKDLANSEYTEEIGDAAANIETTEFEISPTDDTTTSVPDEIIISEEINVESQNIEDIHEEGAEEEKSDATTARGETLESDFFEPEAPEDEEKQQVVEQISGMQEVTEETPEAAEETDGSVRVGFNETEQVAELPAVADNQEEDAEEKGSHRESGLSPDLRRASVQFKRADEDSLVSSDSKPSHKVGERRSLMGRKLSVLSSRGGSIRSTARSIDDPKLLIKEQTDMGRRSSIKSEYTSRKMKRENYSNVELGPRIRADMLDDEELMRGFDMGGEMQIVLDAIAEEEEQTVVEEEEEKFVLNRIPYYERNEIATKISSVRKATNFVLQKMLAMYFRRKKMDYVTKETDWSFDLQTKYYRKLETFGELTEFEKQERARENMEIINTKQERDEKFTQLNTMFKKMQMREGEIGYGLINTKTGKSIPDKMVDRLIHRQSHQMDQVSSMRLTYIKLKEMVQEKLDAISALDEIAPGFLLADYEQLKTLNQSYADKIEEKDEELNRLRLKCSQTIQILAHLREKTAALENDLNDLVDDKTEAEFTFYDVRTILNRTKQHRDVYRHNINKMRDDSGLLTQPVLLKDMEQGLLDAKDLEVKLEHARKDYNKRAKQIKIIRKRIEETKEMRRAIPKKSFSRLRAVPSHLIQENLSKMDIYPGRPSLMMPNIDQRAFECLITVKPKITYDRRKYHTNIKRRPNNNNKRIIDG